MRYAITLLALAACFVLGFSWRDLRQGKLPDRQTLAAIVGKPATAVSIAPKEVFKSAYDNILRNYQGAVDEKRLRFAGMRGLVAALGDPHTMFFDPMQAKDFAIETEGNFVGIGARLGPDPLGAVAVIVFDNGPGARAGLRKGDVITAVDGVSVAGKATEDIVKVIRGKEATMVRLKIIRSGAKQPVTVAARRARVVLPTVETDLVPGTKIGYMSVSGFTERTTEQFDAGLDKLQKLQAIGLIIDLRNNGGGLLTTARDMLSRFVEDKLVVKLKRGDTVIDEERTLTGYKRDFRYPVVVLVNGQSASASEIFAGVMSDYKLATLVGEHTYGKMSVQNVYMLVDGSSAKVTIARYYIPSGREIGRKVDDDGIYLSGGLPPDVLVKYRELDSKNASKSIVPSDSQVQKSVEIIQARTGEGRGAG